MGPIPLVRFRLRLSGITFSLLARCPTFPTDQLLVTIKIKRTMHLPALNLSTRARGLLALLLFLVAWLLGNVGLIAGFEKEAKVLGTATFATACLLWWISYKISCSANGRGITLGVAALSVWMLNLVVGLVFNFHYWIVDSFFWVSTAIFLLLVIALVVSEAAPARQAGPRRKA